MRQVAHGEITSAVESFLRVGDEQTPPKYGRERSWDFCFNYFQDNVEPSRTMELSCLQLGYYLASWGMLRGSSYLFRETNARHYKSVIEIVEQYNPEMRKIDADQYLEPAVQELIQSAYRDLRKALLPDGGMHKTLVSKVMMGTWGVLPSFDSYFVRGFRLLAERKQEKGTFSNINSSSLKLLGQFYTDQEEEIDRLTERFTTLDFGSGELTQRPLPKAKVIDIFGFRKGFRH